jgi:formylmethanofuran dehydrogenase subunit C
LSEIVLTVKAAPALRVDMRGVTPAALAMKGDDAIAHHKVWHGNEPVALGDLFGIAARSGADGAPVLRFVGDLTRFDHIGCALEAGRITLEGGAGDYVGLQMLGGAIEVGGSVGWFAGCEMAGGRLHVRGSVGDFAAGALPGSMDGMRGGEFIVRGSAGARLGDRMRRGLLAVLGNAGDFAASRLVAGTIAIGGKVGAHPAFGMRRGTLLLATANPDLPATFVPTSHDIGVFWHLLAAEIRKVGGVFDALPAQPPLRVAGDLAVDGRGEVLFPA